MAKTQSNTPPPLVAISGDDELQKSAALSALLDEVLPAGVDRGMALTEYDGTRAEDAGGPALAVVLTDLRTLPFLSPLRVVVIRDADRFVSVYREKLEEYAKTPATTGVLVLVVRTFPKTTKLHKAFAVIGRVNECKKLSGRELIQKLMADARAQGKQLGYEIAARLVDLVGADAGLLANELEKLCLYADKRAVITDEDINLLVGQSREEKVFAAMDAAAGGRFDQAVELWRQVLATDAGAVFKAVGGMAFKLRQWVQAQNLLAAGMPIGQVAPKVMMWGREQQLLALLRRMSGTRLRRMLASLAEMDAQAKVGARSIERGVESVLLAVARGT